MNCASYACDPALAMFAFLMGVLAVCAIGALSVHVRKAVYGDRLIDACSGDYKAAALAIENVRRQNELFDEAIHAEFRARRAQFNEGANQDTPS